MERTWGEGGAIHGDQELHAHGAAFMTNAAQAKDLEAPTWLSIPTSKSDNSTSMSDTGTLCQLRGLWSPSPAPAVNQQSATCSRGTLERQTLFASK